MNSESTRPEEAAELRKRAEDSAREEAVNLAEDLEALSPEETRQMLHEVRVHQIKLEMKIRELQKTEKKYRDFIENAVEGVFQITPEGRYIYANPALASLFGFDSPQALMEKIGDIGGQQYVNPEERQTYKNSLESKGIIKGFEVQLLKKDATRIWVSISARAVRNDLGALLCYEGTIEDISERKRVEAEREQALAMLEAAITQSPSGILIADAPDVKIRMANPAALGIRGQTDHALVGIDVAQHAAHWQTFHINGSPYASEELPLSRAILCGEVIQNEDVIICNENGERRWVSVNAAPVRNLAGDITSGIVIFHDLTDLKRVEKELYESERKARAIFDFSFGFVGLLNKDGTIVEINKTALDFAGTTLTDVKGKPFWETPWWSHSPEMQERIRSAVATTAKGELVRSEATHRAKDGTLHIIDFTLKPILDETGSAVWLIAEGRDITERKQAEEALKEREERLKAILAASPNPMVIYDSNGTPLYINPVFTDVFGWTWDELKGHCIPFVPEDQKKITMDGIQEIYRSGSPFVFETQRYTKEGRTLDVIVNAAVFKGPDGASAGMVVNFTDISERKSLQAQYEQAQKMEAIGTLAGGIAHDFNNVLSAIIGYTELIKLGMHQENQVSGYLDGVLTAGNRARDLVKQILTFSRQTKHELKPVSVKLIAKEALKLLRASLPSTIEIKQRMNSDSLVMGDPTQIHQILMNLCTNAGHAMQEKGGTLNVELADVVFDSFFPSADPELKPGSYLKLTVSDTGHGMQPNVLERIFDPFFTTKEKAEGTGMGLAVVHGIVKSFGGVIYAYSEPGKGSIFKVFLPAIESTSEPEKRMEVVFPLGIERILLIDDEPTLVEIGKEMLGNLGYDVLTITNPKEALDLFRTQPDRFDLVITDMTMPKIKGDELARQIIAIRKGIPVILCTGFSSGFSEEKAKEMGLSGFLMKPIIRSELAKLVRKVLDEAKG